MVRMVFQVCVARGAEVSSLESLVEVVARPRNRQHSHNLQGSRGYLSYGYIEMA